MPISGLVIRIDGKKREQIQAAIQQVPGLDLQSATAVDVLVATLESSDFGEEKESTERIAAIAGVTNVSVAYHNFEDMVDAGSAESCSN